MRDKDLMLAVFAQLEREGAVSIPQTATMLAVPEQKVWGALEKLVFCYDIIGMRLELMDSYAKLVGAGRAPILRLTQRETALLIDLLEAQGYSTGSELVSKLVAARGALDADSYEAKVASTSAGDISDMLAALAAACEDPERHLARIEYRKDGAEKAEPRDVEPWVIISEGDYRYLFAWCRKAQGWRSFRVDRIKSLTRLKERFDPAAHDQGVVPSSNPSASAALAHVRFAPGAQLPDWPGLHAGEADEDGGVDAAVPWSGSLWLPKHIVGMLGACAPVDPPALIDATLDYARALLDEQSA